jgi:hypothetical protein
MNRKGVEKPLVGSSVQWETAFSRESAARKVGSALSRYSADMMGKRLFIGKSLVGEGKKQFFVATLQTGRDKETFL